MGATRMTTPGAETGWLAGARAGVGAAWFGAGGAPASSTAVLIVSGIAHEERTMADGLATLSRALAQAGLGSLLIDLHGTAQSTGSLDAENIGQCWRDDIRAALAQLRAAGFAEVIVIGVRLGAMLAFEALRGERIAGFVAWAPIVSGRRYVRELKMLRHASPAEGADAGLSIAGHTIPASLQKHLASLDLTALDGPAATRVLVLDAAELPSGAPWPDALARADHSVEQQRVTQTGRWLFGLDQQPVTPLADIGAILAWCAGLQVPAGASVEPRHPPLLREITFTHAGRRVRERVLRIEPSGLSAIVTEPADAPSTGAARLLATLVGPGRLFPELARDEAARGKTSLRFDFAGFSTSRRRADGSGGELYALDNRLDVRAALEHLRRAGHDRVVMAGFCAGGWSMIHAGALPGVAGLIGINVALYRQPDYRPTQYIGRRGHPASKVLSLLRRMPGQHVNVDRIERRSRLAMDPSRWLQSLCESPVQPMFVYGSDDPGLLHLKRQLGSRFDALLLGGRLGVRTYPGLGHLTEGPGARARALDDIRAFLEAIDRQPGPVSAPQSPGLRASANATTAALPTAASTSSISR